MSLANYTPQRQRIDGPRLAHGGGWTEFEVATTERCSLLLQDRVVMRTPHDAAFLDLSIEQYVGTSRRSKFTSARLESEAARVLYNMLAKHFAAGGDHA
jgi:hypothetical protein